MMGIATLCPSYGYSLSWKSPKHSTTETLSVVLCECLMRVKLLSITAHDRRDEERYTFGQTARLIAALKKREVSEALIEEATRETSETAH